MNSVCVRASLFDQKRYWRMREEGKMAEEKEKNNYGLIMASLSFVCVHVWFSSLFLFSFLFFSKENLCACGQFILFRVLIK
jgi:hypothetical protein